MDKAARTAAVAAGLRRWRWSLLATLFAIVLVCDVLRVAHPWWNASDVVLGVVLWWLPGIETAVRNFRVGYRHGR